MTALGLILLILFLVFFSQPLFVILGTVTAYCYLVIGDGDFQGIIEDLFYAANKELLLAIPLFILAGTIMTKGSIAHRLIEIAKAVTAPIPAGLAMASVLSCAVFAAISGSSPVTLIAIGSMMYPALREAGYERKLSLGLLSAGGTLGIILPPSNPMIVFAIMAGVSVTKLFIAGVGPGILLSLLLMAYGLLRAWDQGRGRWNTKVVLKSLKSGILSAVMPAVILGGIYSGFFTATESAAVAVVYALVVELFIHRQLKLKDLFPVLVETAETLGSLFLILVLAVSLNVFMTYEQIPQSLVEALSGAISSKVTFIIGVNLLLLAVGCLMDVLSAILVLAPLLTPMAVHYGIDPIHFGIIMIVNLEIGYLTPPVGINLFVASSVFKERVGTVIQAVAPLVLVMILGLALISFIPNISLFLIH